MKFQVSLSFFVWSSSETHKQEYIEQYLSKGPYGRQVGLFDIIFLHIFTRQGHTHLLTKIREKIVY